MRGLGLRRAAVATIVVISSLSCEEALADEDTDRLATATSLFEAGQALVRAGQIAQGCAKFEESYRLESANGTLINLADCYERQGRTATAWLTFRDVAGKSARDGQDKRAEVARARAERLAPSLMRLRVKLDAGATPGTVVTRDGVELGGPSLGVPVPVNPGRHVVKAEAPGHRPWRREVVVEAPGTLDVVVPPLVSEVAPNAGLHGMAVGGIVTMAVGGALGLAGLGLGIAARVEADAADCDADNRCSEAGLKTRADALTVGDVGTGFGIAGLVLGSAGFVLWLVAPSDEVVVGLSPGARGYGSPGRLRPMTGALDGVTVLDLSRVLAGPYCTMLLGDLGADVIKIERPGVGDDTRRWGPPFAGDDAAYFHSVNRNKRSLSLDLTSSAGQDVLGKLARRVDVVVHNFQPAVAERLGADHAALSRHHPRLVYCAISSFGPGGPDADRPGYDLLVQAMGGLMSITGDPDGPPTKVGVAIVDVVTGLFAMGGILAALRARDTTGEGQRLDIALQDCLASALVNQAQNYLVSGVAPGRMGNAHPNLVPYQPFAAADGWLVVAGGNDAMFRRLVAALNRPQWADDPRFVDNAARVANRDVLVELMGARIGEASVDHWLERLGTSGVPAGPIRDVGAMLDSPHMRSRGMVTEIEHPVAGPLPMVRNPLHLEPAAPSVRRPPPGLGEHTDELLREVLGADDARLATWRRAGAFGED